MADLASDAAELLGGILLPHIDGDAGEFGLVGQAPFMSSDLPRYPTACSGPSNYPISKS
jgi:hypothetical protein